MKQNVPTDNNKAPQQTIQEGKPFTFWAMDYMGLLPDTARSNQHILLAMDKFSKWYEAFLTRPEGNHRIQYIN